MREYQELYNSGFQLSVEGMELTSIKYERLILVQETLPQSSVKSPDAVAPSADSASLPSRVETLVNSVPQKIQSRHYSTKASFPCQKEIIVPQPVGIVPFHRVPAVIRLSRLANGSFKFDGLDTVNLMHVRPLQAVLNEVRGKLRDLESITAKGYVNSTCLSDYPVLSGYLEAYVKCKKFDKMEPEALSRLSVQEKLSMLDSVLTLNEKRVLVVWLYSLFNLNMYYLLIDILGKCGDPQTMDSSEDIKDIIEDLKSYASKFYGNIIPSIRESLRQRGITVSKNIYCGFDTEYKNIDMTENQILSAQ